MLIAEMSPKNMTILGQKSEAFLVSDPDRGTYDFYRD